MAAPPKPTQSVSWLAGLETQWFREFTTLMAAIMVTYLAIWGFLFTVAAVTWFANTQYLPSAKQEPFVSGFLLAGLVFAAIWWTRRARWP